MAAKYSLTLQQLAERTQAKLQGDPHHVVTGVEDLDHASSSEVSFLANPKYLAAMQKSKAGAICIAPEAGSVPGKNLLISDNPSRTFHEITLLLLGIDAKNTGFEGVHASAVIHPSVKLGEGVQIGPYAVIDEGAEIGDFTQIYPHTYIGKQVFVGSRSILYSHVTIRERCQIGHRVILQPGVVVGSCGFGYTTDSRGEHQKIDQLGIVIIEDDVEIGANTTIDRARFKATVIGKGSKLDNLVQIGHNVQIGPHNIIVSQSGIAGSSKTGRNVIFGGQAGVVGHVAIADFVMVATRGGVSKNITEPGKYAGGPVMPLADYNRQQVHLRKIEEYVKRIEALEAKLNALAHNTSDPS